MPKIDFYLKATVERKASDLHFSSGEPTRLRVDGELEVLDENVMENEILTELLLEILNEDEKKKLLSQRNLDRSIAVPGIGNFRLNIFFTRKGIAAVLRTIPVRIPTLEELRLPPVISELCQLEKGLVLVTGPTGSGKSTTLAAMVNHINATQKTHILTVEDPVEFVHPSKQSLVNQREIGSSCHSFADALKYALREDPDVILIGELRDLETVALALTAAETGHLVFGTLHTRGAGSSVDRIIDSFPANQQSMIRTMLAEGLKAVVSQTLIKRASGKGRVGAYEIMVVNTAISNLIREGKTFQISSAIQVGRKDGMMTLEQSVLELVNNQEVNPEDVTDLIENPSLLEAAIKNRPKTAKPAAKPVSRVPERPKETNLNTKPSGVSPAAPKMPPSSPTAPPSIPKPTISVVTPPTLKSAVPPLKSGPTKREASRTEPSPLTSKFSLQDSFKSLLEDDSNDELLSEMEVIPDPKKKTG